MDSHCQRQMICHININRTALCILFACAVSSGCNQSAGPAVAKVKTIEIESAVGVPMILLPGGQFMMGADDAADDEGPRHEVHVSAVVMDKYEVTQDQFSMLELPDPSQFKDPRHPVEQIRWVDAAEFCNERSINEGLDPCYDLGTLACDFAASGYRLPTEAEWEYAARAGTDSVYHFGGSSQKLASYACYSGNSRDKGTDQVGRSKPNQWGFCDMLGNVSEWCHDVYVADYYAHSPADDPQGGTQGERRVLRGGSWKSNANACRVTARRGEITGFTDACFTGNTLGFRCVRRPNADELAQLTPASK